MQTRVLCIKTHFGCRARKYVTYAYILCNNSNVQLHWIWREERCRHEYHGIACPGVSRASGSKRRGMISWIDRTQHMFWGPDVPKGPMCVDSLVRRRQLSFKLTSTYRLLKFIFWKHKLLKFCFLKPPVDCFLKLRFFKINFVLCCVKTAVLKLA